jgi:hypothetical protein
MANPHTFASTTRRDHWKRRVSRPGAPAVPIIVRNMHRVFWAPAGYADLIPVVLVRRRFRIRPMAQALGVPHSTLESRLARLASWGAIAIVGHRGRSGYTEIRPASDLALGAVEARINVRATERGIDKNLENDVDVARTFRPPDAWVALKTTLFGGGPAM